VLAQAAREPGGVLVNAGRTGLQQPLDAVAYERGGLPVLQRQPAEAVVDGVGNHDVVAHLGGHVLRKQHQALRLVELGCCQVTGCRTVGVTLGTSAERRQDCFEVGVQFQDAVVAGVGHQP
jgi:hypothetical protein